MGKRGTTTDFRFNMESLLDSGVEIAKTSRGGETTYHGPGQVVMYPIIRLKQFKLGARAYVEALEDAMIDTGAEYGLECKGRIPGKTGVWIKDRKIGAVGVAISGGVTRHGVAFNVCPDLSAYSKIIACGDPVAEATSLKNELTDVDLDPSNVAVQLSKNFLKRIQFHGEDVALPDVNKLVDILGHKSRVSE